MPEPRLARLARLQAACLDLLLEPEAESFRSDPEAWAQARALAPLDGRSLAQGRDRWQLYRNLVRTALEDPLGDALPLTQALLTEAEAWEEAVAAFLASRTVQSPYYREVPTAFVAWLAESRWGQDHWPFLLQLAHYEVLELEVMRHPDLPPPPDLLLEPSPSRAAVLEASVRNLAYGFAVHRATPEAPEPPQACAWILCHRDPEGVFRVLELTPHVSALLARSQEGQALGPALEALGVAEEEAFPLLRDFRDRGILLGFREA
ncbi:MAG TPA: putative DNA-binding domain-containing protein [Holophagaceae bacterium]